MKNTVFTIYLLLLFSGLVSSQSKIKIDLIENGWKTIKPLQSNRTQVESLLNNATKNKYITSYDTNDALIHITYSNAPFSDIGSGRFKVNQDTVVDYQVVLKKDVKVSELEWGKNLYKRIDDPEVLQFVDYVNTQDGVSVNAVKLKDGSEKVRIISYFPDHNSEVSLKCAE